jgi:hypothetical protein
MSLTPREHALRVAVLRTLSDEVADGLKAARADAEASFAEVRQDGQTQQKVLLPDGEEIGLVSIRAGSKQTDPKPAEITAWVREHLPDDFEDYIIASFVNHPDIIKWVKARFPDAVGTRIRPATKDALLKEAGDNDGFVTDKESGEKAKIADVTTGKPTGAFSYRAAPGAKDKIVTEWRAGRLSGIDLGPMELGDAPDPVATEPGSEAPAEPVRVPAEGPDFTTQFRPPFGDEHGFLNPQTASAWVAVVVQGFTTPPIEAYRMLRSSNSTEAERARAWLDAYGLDPDDPREGKDTPWPLPAAGSEAA